MPRRPSRAPRLARAVPSVAIWRIMPWPSQNATWWTSPSRSANTRSPGCAAGSIGEVASDCGRCRAAARARARGGRDTRGRSSRTRSPTCRPRGRAGPRTAEPLRGSRRRAGRAASPAALTATLSTGSGASPPEGLATRTRSGRSATTPRRVPKLSSAIRRRRRPRARSSGRRPSRCAPRHPRRSFHRAPPLWARRPAG